MLVSEMRQERLGVLIQSMKEQVLRGWRETLWGTISEGVTRPEKRLAKPTEIVKNPKSRMLENTTVS